MRRVLSSPTKDHTRPRGPSDPYTGSRLPSNDHAHDYTEEHLPSFLRDRQSTNTKQAIKQMAEHRVLLDTNKLPAPLELPRKTTMNMRGICRTRTGTFGGRGTGGARKQRRKMVLYGEMLFAGYLVRHYGAALFRDEVEDPPAGPYRRSAQHASTTPFSRATRNRKRSFDFPATKAMPCTTHDAQDSDSKKRWFSDPRHPGEGKRNPFFRTNSTRMRSGSHRRFSFLRIFST
ncbi:hypothetical protein BJ912DRAFT_995313 [Pholiota molesta]|nr:hypothetical protein BJ912DRAFT_995313 [Pholiota molesta]